MSPLNKTLIMCVKVKHFNNQQNLINIQNYENTLGVATTTMETHNKKTCELFRGTQNCPVEKAVQTDQHGRCPSFLVRGPWRKKKKVR